MFLNLSVVIFIFFPCLLDNSSSLLPHSFFKCSYLLILVCHSHHFYCSQRESNLLSNLINDSPTTFCRYKKCTFPSFLKSYKDNSVVYSVFDILSLTSWANISEWKLLIVFNSSSSILAILPGFLENTFDNVSVLFFACLYLPCLLGIIEITIWLTFIRIYSYINSCWGHYKSTFWEMVCFTIWSNDLP